MHDDTHIWNDSEKPSTWVEDVHVREILEEYNRRQMVESLTGPGVSLTVHLVLLLIGMVYLLTRDPSLEPIKDMEITRLPPPNLPEIEKVELDIPTPLQKIEKLKVPIPRPKIEQSGEPSPVDAPTELAESNEECADRKFLDTVAYDTRIKYTATGGLENRGDKGTGLGKYGDGESVRTNNVTVPPALNWLARVQNENGSWGTGTGWGTSEGHPAHTGLALLAFLGHGETPLSETYGNTVRKAMRWLADYGMQSDLAGVVTRGPHGTGTYAHAIATYALSDAYAMTRIEPMRISMENCVDHLVKGQMSNGGFGYQLTSGPRWDVSVSGWCVQALKAARMAGSSNDDLSHALERSARFFRKTAYQGKGIFGYAQNNPKGHVGNMTGVGVLALQYLGSGRERQVKDALAYIGDTRYRAYRKVIADPTQWEVVAGECLYGWYYDTQAIFNDQLRNRESKVRWRKWRGAFETALHRSQHPDGYWQTSGRHGIGAHQTAGRILSTSLCVLQLEVYYRFLPNHSNKDHLSAEPVVIEIDAVGNGTTGGVVL